MSQAPEKRNRNPFSCTPRTRSIHFRDNKTGRVRSGLLASFLSVTITKLSRIHDGLAICDGKAFVALEDGRLLCLGSNK